RRCMRCATISRLCRREQRMIGSARMHEEREGAARMPAVPHAIIPRIATPAMIGRLNGILVEKNPPQLLLDVQGVGYEVDVPMSTFYNLPQSGERITLFTHLVVREDAHLLYGFGTENERRAFRQLLKVNGIGAKIALALLSGLSVAELA